MVTSGRLQGWDQLLRQKPTRNHFVTSTTRAPSDPTEDRVNHRIGRNYSGDPLFGQGKTLMRAARRHSGRSNFVSVAHYPRASRSPVPQFDFSRQTGARTNADGCEGTPSQETK